MSAFLTVQGVIENGKAGRAAPRHPRVKAGCFAEFLQHLPDEGVTFHRKRFEIVVGPTQISVQRLALHRGGWKGIMGGGKSKTRAAQLGKYRRGQSGLGQANDQEIERFQRSSWEFQRPPDFSNPRHPGRVGVKKEGDIGSEFSGLGIETFVGSAPPWEQPANERACV